ncbi:polyprotein [Goose calicivirus]|uniref:polyprotein n=1 Tax=Goose calicivirus TaxID=1493858 RepID=UPI0004587C30|nr:polyprotein [Goose calicivirus]AHY39267.1 polyprotein [Goose calicivirus]
MLALDAFGCHACAAAYVDYMQFCGRHKRKSRPYLFASRLAQADHARACRAFRDEPDPLEEVPPPEFWKSVRSLEEEHTKCHLCAATYAAYFFRTSGKFDDWKRTLPRAYHLRRHSPTCEVCKGQFELQGAGNSTARTIPRTRAPGLNRLANELSGPNQRPDADLTARIMGLLADDTSTPAQIIKAVEDSIKSGSGTPPRATLAQVWRNLNYENAPDRAAAILTAVTLWLADNDALNSAELNNLRPVRNPIARNWVQTLKKAVEGIEQWFVTRSFGAQMRSVIEVVTQLLQSFAEGNQSIDALLQTIEPIPLMALALTFDGTPLGFATYILGVLQLYGLLDAELIAGCAQAVVDALSTFASRVFGMLSPFGVQIEAQSTTSIAVAIGAMICVWIIGHLPGEIASELRRAAATATSLLAMIKIAKLAFDLARRFITTRHVNSLTDRVLDASIEVVKPVSASYAPNRRQQLKNLKQIQDEITSHMVKVDYAVHLPTLKALNATLTGLIVRLNQIEGQGTAREPPVGVVFCGPPGIGKTTLATWVLDQISPDTVHSNFSMQIDHSDAYTGEFTCLWDEFDTDPNMSFVEGVIGIFNKTAYPLNCDLAENKGRVWASRVVAMTTNTPTPVSPDSTRAHAFYRRLIFYDVSSPAVDKFMKENPGVDPPASLFKDDFSHLRITRRPYLADIYTPQGDTLDGVRARPINCTPKAIIKEIRARLGPEFQAAPPQAIGLIVPDEFAADVRAELLHSFSTNNSFVKLVEVRGALTTADLHNARGGHVIATAGAEDPAIKDWYVVTHVNQAANDLNTKFGLCPKLPHEVNHGFRTRLFRTIVHAGALPPSALPPQQSFTCKRLGDFLGVLRSVYGPAMLPIIARIASRLEVKSWTAFFASLADITWGYTYHSYVLKTDAGVFYVYTHDFMSVFSTTDKDHCVDTQSAPPVSSMTIWEMFKSICRSLCKILASHLNTAATATAITYYAQLVRSTPQTNSRGMVRNFQAGVALSDEEYNTWRDYNTRVDARATVNDFIQARDSLINNAAITTERVAQLARWLQARQTNVFEPQSGNYADFCAPCLRADGTRLGWAIHIGNGRWATNTHGIDELASVDGHDFEVLKKGTNDITILKAHEIPHAANLGQGPPVRTWDNRPLHNTYEHTVTQCHIPCEGWLCHVNGGTYKGDCGLPYYNSVGQVCGLHSGFYRGTRQSLISRFKVETPAPTTWRGLPVENSGLMLGPLRKGTSYSRSVAHPKQNVWEDYEPAPYGGADPRNCMTQERILANQLTPYVEAPQPLHPIVEEASRYVQRHIASIISFCNVPQLEPFALALKRLDLGTTCGPFVPGIKRDYFALTPSGPVLKPGTELTRHLDSIMAVAGSGRPITHAYQLALKDELLPKRKIAESRKRLLWGTDVGLTTLAAMVWGQLLDSLKSVVIASPISVGCQMDSTFVATIVAQIQDRHTLCLDYKKWDSTMHPEVINFAVDILCDLCPDTPYRECLRSTLHMHPVGYFMDKKLTALRGLPSGMPATSVINSLCHCIYFTSALWLAEDQAGIARTRDPLTVNRIWTYGDDCIYAFHPRCAAIMDSFIEALRQLGLTPTAADKTQNFLMDSDITFLKRDIVPLNNLVVGRLDLHSILRQAVWVHGSMTMDHTLPKLPKDTSARTVQVQEALLALALHGQEIYNTWKHLFHETIVGEGLLCEVEDWETQMMLYRSRYITADPYSNALLSEGDIQTDCPQNEFEFQNNEKEGSPAQDTTTTADQSGITVAYTPTQAVVGSAGAPQGESLALATLGAGLPNTLPSGVEGLFIAAARYSWNTTQPTRQIIGTVKLDPTSNPFLDLLSHMYTGWSGGMFVRVQVSGSGMYGGRVIASILPPDVEVENMTNPTAYPYAIVDARVPEPVQLYLPDIRRTAYHLVGGKDNVTKMVLSVSSPLINPFGTNTNTTSAVEITVYTTPAPDFTFCLMREPTSFETKLVDILGESTLGWFSNRVQSQISTWTTASSARQSWNHYAVDGTTKGWGLGAPGNFVEWEIQVPGSSNFYTTNRIVTWTKTNFDEDVAWPSKIHPYQPDYAQGGGPVTNLSPSSSGNWNRFAGQIYGAAAMFTSGAGTNSFTDETQVLAVKVIYGKPDVTGLPSSYGFTFSQEMNPDCDFYYIYGSAPRNSTSTNYQRLAGYKMVVGNSSDQNFRQLFSPDSPTVYAPVGQSFITFGAPTLVDVPTENPSAARNSLFYCTQPMHLSVALRQHGMTMAPDAMAVYRLSSPYYSFEIGIRPDGYIVTGGSANVTLPADTEYTIHFAGYSSLTSRLLGPVAASTASTMGTSRGAIPRN